MDKRGAKSDETYTREVLGEISQAHSILVINDEAHHAWRINLDAQQKYTRKKAVKDSHEEEATTWVGDLDRLHKTRKILACHDFSATPFAPSGNRNSEETLFGWIVSDFGLSNAIESGLVKTPRVVVRDDALPDAKTWKSRLYHLYNAPNVKDNLNSKQVPKNLCRIWPPMPIACSVTTGMKQRGNGRKNAKTTPVMISVANRTETAARIRNSLEQNKVKIDKLCNPERILHIDSKVLAKAEAGAKPSIRTVSLAAALRRIKTTCGHRRHPQSTQSLTFCFDRMKITSPGALTNGMTIERIKRIKSGAQVLRNPKLARIFRGNTATQKIRG